MTELGKMNAYKKGQEFEQNYHELLKDHGELISYCSNKNRNIETLYMRLKGIFPNRSYMFNESLGTFNTSDFLIKNYNTSIISRSKHDFMFRPYDIEACTKKHEDIMTENKILPKMIEDVDKLLDEHSNLFEKYLNFGKLKEMKSYIKVFYISDFLDKFQENEVVLLEDDLKLKELLKDYYRRLVDSSTFDRGLTSLLTSSIYATLIENFDRIVNKTDNTDAKVILFSAHDTQLSSLLKILEEDVSDYKLDYNDEITYLLNREDGSDDFNIRVKYNDDFIKIKIGNAMSDSVPYITFRQHIMGHVFSEEDLIKFCTVESVNKTEDL